MAISDDLDNDLVGPEAIIQKTKNIIVQCLDKMVLDDDSCLFPVKEIASLCLMANTYQDLKVDSSIESIMLNIPIIINRLLGKYESGQYPLDEVGCLCEMKTTYFAALAML